MEGVVVVGVVVGTGVGVGVMDSCWRLVIWVAVVLLGFALRRGWGVEERERLAVALEEFCFSLDFGAEFAE